MFQPIGTAFRARRCLGIACWIFAGSTLIAGCGRPYQDLSDRYPDQGESPSQIIEKRSLVIVSRDSRKSQRLGDVVMIGLSDESIHIRVEPPADRHYAPVQISVEAVTGCSITCFGNGKKETDLLLGSMGMKLGFGDSPEIVEWCWARRIPFISAKSKRKWLYSGAELEPIGAPIEEDYGKYLSQVNRACSGY